MNKGFGLIGLIIVMAIAMALIFGYRFFGAGEDMQNRIESGNDAVERAREAAELQRQNSLYLQNEIADPPPVNFQGVRDSLDDLR